MNTSAPLWLRLAASRILSLTAYSPAPPRAEGMSESHLRCRRCGSIVWAV
jgi:hypothetical protein